jgi:hypothetical protein
MKEIHLFCEGGGDGRDSKQKLKIGFVGFLRELILLARSKRIRFNVTMCGSRLVAYDKFQTALQTQPDVFNVLLVDSEAPVDKTPWEHLRERDGWSLPGCNDDHCHLMVQAMEAWLIADPDALKKYYGQNFNGNAIPKTSDVEQISAARLEPSLRNASRNTQKGEYQKIKHASELLERHVDPSKVRKASGHCERLFAVLANKM